MANPSSHEYYMKGFIWAVIGFISCIVISFITCMSNDIFNVNEFINPSSFDTFLIMIILKYKIYILIISLIVALSMVVSAIFNYYRLGCT